jgi:hypothetical protein
MSMPYNFKDKDFVIDIMRTLIQLRADMEGMKFNKVLSAIEKETKGGVKFATMYGWFAGPTRYPRYCLVARVILCLQRYARKPVAIGDTRVYVIPRVVRQRRAA